MRVLKYLSYLLRHKWFVMTECFRLGLYRQGIMHDMSKFLPSEFIPYMNHFFGNVGDSIDKGRDETGYYKPTDTGDEAFDFAWLLHQKRNRHHWQWWLTASIDKCYNSRRDIVDEVIVCDYTRPIKIKSFASVVDLSVLYRIFRIQQGNIDFSVKNIGKNTVLNKGGYGGNQASNKSMIKKGIGVILKFIEKKQEEKQGNIVNFALSIMGAIRLSVVAVASNTASFCVLTILTEVEANIEQALKRRELLCIVGLLSANFPKDFVSFVPIVIRHMPIMDTVHTINEERNILPILPDDEGGLKVLEMPTSYRKEMLADWRGAGRAQGKPDTKKWYGANGNKMLLGTETREWIEKEINQMGLRK